MKEYKLFPNFRFKIFNEMKSGDKYYYLETEFMRFHEDIWGKDNKWAIDLWKLEENGDKDKPYTVQSYNGTRTIFGTSKIAILLCVYYRYLKIKKNK